jgi:hypothetical protein
MKSFSDFPLQLSTKKVNRLVLFKLMLFETLKIQYSSIDFCSNQQYIFENWIENPIHPRLAEARQSRLKIVSCVDF